MFFYTQNHSYDLIKFISNNFLLHFSELQFRRVSYKLLRRDLSLRAAVAANNQ